MKKFLTLMIVAIAVMSLTGSVAKGDSCKCLGDANGDGYVDGGDIPGFIGIFGSVIGDPFYNPCLDFNGDGRVDGGDVPGFIAAFGTVCP